MASADKVFSLQELRDLSADPGAAALFSPFSDLPFVLLDASSGGIPSNEAVLLGRWLQELPVPSLGVAPPGTDNAATRACDALLPDAKSAAPLVTNIRRNPIAAGTLAQTLRITPDLPVPQALVVESLAYATLQGSVEFKRWLETHKADTPAVPNDPGPPVIMEREEAELRLVLNRASNRNAINVEMRDALVEALQLAMADPSITSIKVSGNGKCFSVGGDLTEFGTLPDPATAHAIRSITMPGKFFAACAERLECHVHGACIGSGVELPAFSKRVTAAADTFFHMPEIEFGLIPGGGGCVSIPRRIGRQRAAWWFLSTKRINAKTALEWGLVDAIESQGA